MGFGSGSVQIWSWSKQARTSCSSWLSLVGLLWSGGRPPEELNLFVFQRSNKTDRRSTASANILATVVECVRVGRFSNNGEWGRLEKHADKVCFSLVLKPHSTLIYFYTSNPIRTNTEDFFSRLSAVSEYTMTERCLFLFKAGHPTRKEMLFSVKNMLEV